MRLKIAIFFLALFTSVSSSLANAAGVLAAKTEDDKAAILIKSRRTGLAAADVIKLTQREKSDAIVSLALGLYLESAKVDAEEAAAVVSVLAKRKSLYGLTATMCAINKPMVDVVDGLINGKRGGGADDKQFAAAVLLMFARCGDLGPVRYGPPKEEFAAAPDPKAAAKKKKKRRAPVGVTKAMRALVTPLVKSLLESKDDLTLERAIVAAAYMKLDELKAEVAALADHRSLEVQAARLLYAAHTGQPLDETILTRLFANSRRADTRYARLTPAMSNYNVDTSAQAYACQAIGVARATAHLALLHKALNNRDLRVQIDAARALGNMASPESTKPLLALLKDSSWPVLMAAYDALGAIGSKEAIEPLITKLEKEKGRFRLDLTYALSSIAGEQQSKTPDGWRRWWEGAKSTFQPDPAKTKAFRAKYRVQDMNIPHLGFFYHLPIYSDRLTFVLDTSASMKGEKIASLKSNLNTTLTMLRKKVLFNVVDFGGHVKVMFPRKLVTAASGSSAAIQHVGYMKLTLGTRTYDGIEAGIWLPTVDTVVYLSDGAPVASKINAWSRIMRALHIMNRYRPVAMFCVEFNAGKTNAAAMNEIAARNFGLAGSPNDGEN